MRSDSDRNMSASLTRITRQVSRTFDLNLFLSIQEVLYCYSSAMTSSCFHIYENKKHGGSPYADLYEKALMQAGLQHTFSYKPAHD